MRGAPVAAGGGTAGECLVVDRAIPKEGEGVPAGGPGAPRSPRCEDDLGARAGGGARPVGETTRSPAGLGPVEQGETTGPGALGPASGRNPDVPLPSGHRGHELAGGAGHPPGGGESKGLWGQTG